MFFAFRNFAADHRWSTVTQSIQLTSLLLLAIIWINGDIAEQETKFAAHCLATFILLVCVWPALLSTVLAMCFGSKLAASPR